MAAPFVACRYLPLVDLPLHQLGASFDLKAFHQVVLDAGAVTLPVLAERVNAYAR